MLKVIIRSRTLRAMGSVIDLLPVGDYSEHMPNGNCSARIAGHWQSSGNYLRKAIDQYDEGTSTWRSASEQREPA
jgi:hypothetical protein